MTSFGIEQFVNGRQCVGLTHTHGNQYLTDFYAVDTASQYFFEVTQGWDWGSYPAEGFAGETLMDRAYSSCDAAMTRNGLEATEDWCCQVVMYVGTKEVPSSSTWQDGDWVVIADPIQVTETRWNPFAITHEGNQAYLGGITKQEWLNPPTDEGAVEPE